MEQKQGEFLEFRIKNGVQKLNLNEISFFESDVRIVEAHMIDGKVHRFYGKLDTVEQKVPEGSFLRCHQSFLVNCSRIRKFGREYLMLGKQKVPVSRKYYNRMREAGMIGKNHEWVALTKKAADAKVNVHGNVRGISGNFAGRMWQICPNEKLILGKDFEHADIIFYEEKISDQHCWIQYHDGAGRYFICNLSPKGMMINDEFVNEIEAIRELKPGDQFSLGRTEEVFQVG